MEPLLSVATLFLRFGRPPRPPMPTLDQLIRDLREKEREELEKEDASEEDKGGPANQEEGSGNLQIDQRPQSSLNPTTSGVRENPQPRQTIANLLVLLQKTIKEREAENASDLDDGRSSARNIGPSRRRKRNFRGELRSEEEVEEQETSV